MNACVRAVLCGLIGAPVRAVFAATIDVVILGLQAQLAAVTAQLVALEIQLVPLELLKNAADAALAAARSVGNLVPMQIMAGCPDLGDVMKTIDDSLASTQASVVRKLNSINRSLSFKAELEALSTDLSDAIGLLNELKIEMRC